MKSITFEMLVATSGGASEKTPIQAYFIAPGLVVHHEILKEGRVVGKSWRVSHSHSGYYINYIRLRTRKAAVEMALKLAALADWDRLLTFDGRWLGISPETLERVKAIIRGENDAN